MYLDVKMKTNLFSFLYDHHQNRIRLTVKLFVTDTEGGISSTEEYKRVCHKRMDYIKFG